MAGPAIQLRAVSVNVHGRCLWPVFFSGHFIYYVDIKYNTLGMGTGNACAFRTGPGPKIP